MPEMTLSLILGQFKIYLYPNMSSGLNINAKINKFKTAITKY